ncbi:unnamed protein product [Brassica oleracea]
MNLLLAWTVPHHSFFLKHLSMRPLRESISAWLFTNPDKPNHKCLFNLPSERWPYCLPRTSREREEYFSGLGIIVPKRINPPDYYIDVLEGIVANLNSDVSIKELPQRWMLHEGFSVPLDMRKNNNNSAEPTFVRELLGDVTSNFKLRGDKIRHNFLKTRDLSYRRTPSMWLQYKYFLGRYLFS